MDTLQAGAVIVLEQTLSTALTGSWRAMGLVRNETEVLTGADVTASIWGEDGTLLGDATSHVLVDPLRPGEPGPFVLDSSIPVAKVADVTWSVKATGTGSLGLRDFLITAPIWELPYGNRDRWDTDAEKEQPFPYVAYGSVDNLAAGVVRQPTIFAAWLDTEGRVRWVDSAVVGIAPNDPELSATLPDDLGPRWIGDFYFLVDDPDVARLFGDPASDGLEAMFWAGSDGYSEGG